MHKNCFNCVLYILISQPQFCCWPGLCWRWSFSLWSFCCQLGDVRFVTCSTYGPHRQAECLWMAGSTVRRKGERIMLHHVGQCWTSNDQCSDVFPVWRRMQKFHANGYIYFFVLDARMRKLPYSFLCCQNEFHLSVVSFLRVGARGDVLIYQAAPRDASMLLGMRRRLQDWGAIANMYETLRNYFPDLRLHLSGPHQIAPNYLPSATGSSPPQHHWRVWHWFIGRVRASFDGAWNRNPRPEDVLTRRLARKTGLSAEDVEVAVPDVPVSCSSC
jgi:hypothetical protein